MPYVLNALYAFGLIVLSPWLLFRAVATGRYRRGIGQKLFGASPIPQTNKPVVWFHGVSVGEINLLVTVIKAFRKRHPEYHCVVSTTTDTGMAEAKKRFADLTVLYFPFDFSWAVKRTIKNVRPQMIILAESELWPNFLYAAAKRQVPVVIINGRMSPRSAHRYRKLGFIARPLLLSRITRFIMQTDGYADALKSLRIPNERIAVCGSVKYDGVLAERDNPQTRKLRDLFRISDDDLVWVAGSTHAPEEEIILKVFARLRDGGQVSNLSESADKLETCPTRLRLILVPRSPDRFEEVYQLIRRTGLTVRRRSEIDGPIADTPDVILIDTIGELNAAWGLADVGFTGGSLGNRRGGQSMIEPAGLGVPVVFGPNVWNFRDAAARLIEVGGATEVATPEETEKAIGRLLWDRELRDTMGKAARQMVLAQQGATERTLDEMDEVFGESFQYKRVA